MTTEWLKQTPISAFKQDKVIAVDSQDTLIKAFKTLTEHNIYTAPVLDKQTTKCLGLIGLRDIAAFIVGKIGQELGVKDTKGFDKVSNSKLETSLVSLENYFNSHNVRDAINYSQQNPLTTLPVDSTLGQVAQQLGSFNRVPIVDKNGAIVHILGGTDIIRFIDAKAAQLGDIISKPIKDLGITKKAHVVPPQARVFDVIAQLVNAKIGVLALYDSESDELISAISLKDISLAATNGFKVLLQQVEPFVSSIRLQNLKTVHPFLNVQDTSPLDAAIQKLLVTKVHRLFVKGVKSLDVIAVGDIVRYFFPN